MQLTCVDVKCKECSADLTQNKSIVRVYWNIDERPDITCAGHYQTDSSGNHCFMSDQGLLIDEWKFEPVEEPDICSACGAIIKG